MNTSIPLLLRIHEYIFEFDSYNVFLFLKFKPVDETFCHIRCGMRVGWIIHVECSQFILVSV